jgi:hypothetical protein
MDQQHFARPVFREPQVTGFRVSGFGLRGLGFRV